MITLAQVQAILNSPQMVNVGLLPVIEQYNPTPIVPKKGNAANDASSLDGVLLVGTIGLIIYLIV